ncbi:hypothetical protein Acy02nite_49940 [Actinoplanes cyaneus]|uniref:Uncharacterized protein n=1 Tax=Actinoplanes cyaneus TaxID=52696 RepID=A0A919IKJ5_9ACTN|nr:hypothetical protein [Actinoplanes cyaneus]GID67113.1 hypothetical protein Acy02nite_49940 [Actinoplanes cyaneus]
MENRTRALPYDDLAALLQVVAILDAHLVSGELSPDLTHDLIRRMVTGGALPEGASTGALNGVLSDLAQRLHWAMGTDMDYPTATSRKANYQLTIPADAVAACVAALRAAGADEVHDGPSRSSGWEMLPTGPGGALERHSSDVPDGRAVTAAFPELAPDPAYQQRIAWLTLLAQQHGGQYEGATW